MNEIGSNTKEMYCSDTSISCRVVRWSTHTHVIGTSDEYLQVNDQGESERLKQCFTMQRTPRPSNKIRYARLLTSVHVSSISFPCLPSMILSPYTNILSAQTFLQAPYLLPTVIQTRGGALTSLLSSRLTFLGVCAAFIKLFARPRRYCIAASAAALSIVRGVLSTDSVVW